MTNGTSPSQLPEDYPKTADIATVGILESFDGGQELWEKAFTEDIRNTLIGSQVVSIGAPTNSFGPNMWFVPYTIRFKNGAEKTMRLHIAQDSRTQRWILKGGI